MTGLVNWRTYLPSGRAHAFYGGEPVSRCGSAWRNHTKMAQTTDVRCTVCERLCRRDLLQVTNEQKARK